MKEINFRRIVQEVEDAYDLDDEQLAAKCKTHRSTINRLKNGAVTQPAYQLGAVLVRMHDERHNLRVKQ